MIKNATIRGAINFEKEKNILKVKVYATEKIKQATIKLESEFKQEEQECTASPVDLCEVTFGIAEETFHILVLDEQGQSNF